MLKQANDNPNYFNSCEYAHNMKHRVQTILDKGLDDFLSSGEIESLTAYLEYTKNQGIVRTEPSVQGLRNQCQKFLQASSRLGETGGTGLYYVVKEVKESAKSIASNILHSQPAGDAVQLMLIQCTLERPRGLFTLDDEAMLAISTLKDICAKHHESKGLENLANWLDAYRTTALEEASISASEQTKLMNLSDQFKRLAATNSRAH